MALKHVMGYEVGYKKGTNTESAGNGWIRLIFDDGGSKSLSVHKDDYHGFVDILRNEKPLVWDEDRGFLYASTEPIGEDEGDGGGSRDHP